MSQPSAFSKGFAVGLILFCSLDVFDAAESSAIEPLTRAHAHNDYEHARPLLDALDNGFCSIEADVFLVEGQLMVAHERNRVVPKRTLQALYLEPLRERVKRNGGRVYPGGPVCTLFVDLKTEAEGTYAALHRLLAEYGELVTRFESNRVVTNAVLVIVSGNQPRATIAEQTTRFAACDGRLLDLESNPSPLLVPIVSEHWGRLFKWRGNDDISPEDLNRLRELVTKAHGQGRRLRFWAIPDLTTGWRVLYDAGVDLINTDDLKGARDFLLAR